MKFNAVNAILAPLALASTVAANTEKIIFLAPPVDVIPLASPSLQDLKVDTLSPQKLSIQRNLTRVFADGGKDSWYLLDNLTEGKRYELRVCWAATVRIRQRDTVVDTRTYSGNRNQRNLTWMFTCSTLFGRHPS